MMRKLRGKPRIGLTLGSGGAKGLSHIAFIKVLDEKDIKPAVISGTSIGALIGAFYAGGMSGLQMEDLFDDMGIRRMGSMMDPSIFSNSGLLKGKKVEAFLADNLPCRDFSDLPIPLKVVATDFWNREEVVFSSGDLVTAVCASISVPVVMEPKLVEDRVLTDGGAVRLDLKPDNYRLHWINGTTGKAANIVEVPLAPSFTVTAPSRGTWLAAILKN